MQLSAVKPVDNKYDLMAAKIPENPAPTTTTLRGLWFSIGVSLRTNFSGAVPLVSVVAGAIIAADVGVGAGSYGKRLYLMLLFGELG